MRTPPTGTVTFLLTDVEGSTRLWQDHADAMRPALAQHDRLLRSAIEASGGYVFKTVGDAFCAAFATAPEALTAALSAQLSLVTEPWGPPTPLRVRMALHTGSAEERDGDYFGPPLNRGARLMAAGHGGQVLLSEVTQGLILDTLCVPMALRDLGEHRLKDMGRPETVFQLLHPNLPADFPPLRSLDHPAFPNNLPQQPTSFIGREEEVSAVEALAKRSRLVTLAGAGGAGKSRLALQVAADLIDQFPDGVWLVEFAPLADAALVPQAVVGILGVREEPGEPLARTLVRFLTPKHLLLVLDNCEHLLDNCEHLLDACASLTSELLRSCPHARLLASSREALGVAGEQTYRVPSLSLPDLAGPLTPESTSQFEAVELFIQRARFVQPAFAVTNANAPAVAQVCWRLDGIPLAIELAAARVRVMPVEQLCTRLDDCFRLLTGSSRTGLPRQQTLRALIDWSYDLLTEPEKRLLRRLSVFVGGWSLEAAEAVGAGNGLEAGEVLDRLTEMVDKSLVLSEEQEGRARYRLLETVRQYARDRLLESGVADAVRTRHCAYFVELAEQAAPMLEGSQRRDWLARLEYELGNLRAAFDWCAGYGDGEAGLRLAGVLFRLWDLHGHYAEGRARVAVALAHPQAQKPTLARGKSLQLAGFLALRQQDYSQARLLLTESLAIFRALDDEERAASVLKDLGGLAGSEGDMAAARAFFEEVINTHRRTGARRRLAAPLANLASLSAYDGDLNQAETLLGEAHAIDVEFGVKGGQALLMMGNVAIRRGEIDRARQMLCESLMEAKEVEQKPLTVWLLEALAEIAQAQGQAAHAARLGGTAQALREAIGLPVNEKSSRQQIMNSLREGAGAAAWAEGRALSWEQAIECALAMGSEAPRGGTPSL